MTISKSEKDLYKEIIIDAVGVAEENLGYKVDIHKININDRSATIELMVNYPDN